ncbi:MAG: ABC transporter permease [Saccharofermentans sp.]|nr:ABC transporter permease [Saccharofermentans sp.]
MLNLLLFEFRRMSKSLFFKIIGAYCLVWPIIVALFYRGIIELTLLDTDATFADFDMSGDELRFLTWMVGVAFVNELPKFIALFTVLHIGRDFSDGIVRNKITAGHSRTSIFFSYMITQICATVLMCVTYIGGALFGLTIAGFGVDLNRGEMFLRFGVAIMILLVLTVTFTVISLMFRRRAMPIILSIVMVMFMSTASAIIGNFNLPAKAVDDYIETRHERYEEMIEDGSIDEDLAEELEDMYDRDHYLGIPWKICHPAYLITNLGFNGDYSTDLTQVITGGLEYSDELDFTNTFVSDYDYFNADMSMLTAKDFKHTDSMHVSYTRLNLTYTLRSVAWMLLIGGWGYVIFRKKNLF